MGIMYNLWSIIWYEAVLIWVIHRSKHYTTFRIPNDTTRSAGIWLLWKRFYKLI